MRVYIELEKCAHLEWLDKDEDYYGIQFHLLPFWLKIRHKENQGTEEMSCNIIKTVYSTKDWKIKEAYLGILEDESGFHGSFKIKLPTDRHIPVHRGIKIDEKELECV